MIETRSVCCYCGVGCGVIVQSAGERIVDVRGDPEHPANFGRLCSKGNTLHLAAVQTGRATVPILRESRAVLPAPTSWDYALDVAAERFARIIQEHGPDAVAFYVSGQLLTEDYYVFNKLARALVGTHNIDSNSRLCMSSAVAAYKATLGADAVPCSYEDIDHSDLMLIAGSNTAFAHPVVFRRIEAAREKNPDLKLIVVDPRRTDTAAGADLLLPAATWGEKDGTVTNSERRISRVRAAVPAPGAARADWRICRDFARLLATKVGADGTALFAYESPAEVYAEYVKTTIGRDLDIGGLSHEALDALGPQQWPVRDGVGTDRLYRDHRFAFPDGKARFISIDTRLTAEAPDARHPFRLITGRLRDQWHGMSRTGRVPRLYSHEPEPRIEVHASDLNRRGWHEGQLMRVKSRRGEIVLPVAASAEVKPGQAFVAMHWGRRSLSHDGVNALTIPACDPVSKQPELKHAALRIEPAALPWRMVVLRSPGLAADAHETVLAWRGRLAPLLDDLDYAALTLDGRERPLVALRLALAAPPSAASIEQIARALDMPEEACLAYRDPAKNVVKRALIEDERLAGILLAGEALASNWLRAAMKDGVPIDALRRWLFAPRAEPPVGAEAAAAPRKVVCNCLDVSEADIRKEIAAGADLPALQEKLKCGTSCGSCVPEIKRMLAVPQVA